MFQELIDFFDKHSVLVLGFGREGRSTYELIRRKLPDKRIGIADIREIEVADSRVDLFCGENYLDALREYEVVVKTPGMSFRDVEVPQGVQVTCQTDLFLRFADCTCVGVTGTKGKTTTSTLIYDIVKQAGKSAVLIGNMGVPVLDSLEKTDVDIAVVEMSSHQLEFTTASPHIAVLTNIYPEHLDHYSDFDGYVQAKMNIVKHQLSDDYLICNSEQNMSAYFDFATLLPSVIKVSMNGGRGDEAILAAAAQNDRLKGAHNRQNVCFAATVARCLDIDEEAIIEAICTFKGIEHRMEPIGEYHGITFYNDSIATIPHAVESAIEALENVDTLIFGGMDRGIDYSGFDAFLEKCNVRNLIGMPQTGEKICNALLERGCTKNIIHADTMAQAVDAAFRFTREGGICLFSPAAASYNMYKDFEEKGNHFKSLVKQWNQ